MSVTKAISENITSLDAAKLTGTLPAMSGAALTNLPAPTKSANDPTISTNPSGGVGTLWANTTSGEMFACTDATAGANVWVNVGSGSGDVEPFHGAGLITGFVAGGSSPASNVIDKFSLTSDADASDHGDLTVTRAGFASASSATHGYHSGGTTGGGATFSNVIDRFTFASNANAVDVGNMTLAIGYMEGVFSTTHGYTLGGNTTGQGAGKNDTINKYSFSASNNATDSGNLTVARYNVSPQQSETHGYASGGANPTNQDVIDKFSFASGGNSTDVGNLQAAYQGGHGHSTATHGYSSNPNGQIGKFSFASDGNAVNHCTMFAAGNSGASNSSVTHGYCSGGGASAPSLDMIQKFNFSSSSNGTDVANLTVGRYSPRGTQY